MYFRFHQQVYAPDDWVVLHSSDWTSYQRVTYHIISPTWITLGVIIAGLYILFHIRVYSNAITCIKCLIYNCFMLQNVTGFMCNARPCALIGCSTDTRCALIGWAPQRKLSYGSGTGPPLDVGFNGVTNAVSALYSMDGARRTRVSLLGWVALFIGAVNASSPTDSEFTFQLPAASKECFYQNAVQNGSIEIEYQVT